MIKVLHIYDNSPVVWAWKETLPDFTVDCHPCNILAFSPEILQKKEFSLIIFDVLGRGKSSIVIFEQLERWIEISGVSRPPVIVATEENSDLTEQSARMAGADFFFIKPVDIEQLVKVFKQIESRADNP